VRIIYARCENERPVHDPQHRHSRHDPCSVMYNPMSRDFHLHRTPVDVLNYEIVEEQAAALGRMGRALEAALAKLREFDAAHRRAGAPASAQQARRTMVMQAGHALWMFVVQREACGLRDSRTVIRDYSVPGECAGRGAATHGGGI